MNFTYNTSPYNTTSYTVYTTTNKDFMIKSINYYIQISLCLLSVSINSIMYCTVLKLRHKAETSFLIGISLLVVVEIFLCVTYCVQWITELLYIYLNVFLSSTSFSDVTPNIFRFVLRYGSTLLRNYWVACITLLRMLKVRFPLKERYLVGKTFVKKCFGTICCIATILACFDYLIVSI